MDQIWETMVGPAMLVMGFLSIAVAGAPVLLIVALILKVPIRRWIPALLLVGLIFMAQGVTVLLGGEEGIAALLFLLAGYRP